MRSEQIVRTIKFTIEGEELEHVVKQLISSVGYGFNNLDIVSTPGKLACVAEVRDSVSLRKENKYLYR